VFSATPEPLKQPVIGISPQGWLSAERFVSPLRQNFIVQHGEGQGWHIRPGDPAGVQASLAPPVHQIRLAP